MKSFLSRILKRADEPPPVPVDPDRVSRLLEAIDAGVAQRPSPTLVCRKCGLKYNNTGTFLHGAQCPDCADSG